MKDKGILIFLFSVFMFFALVLTENYFFDGAIAGGKKTEAQSVQSSDNAANNTEKEVRVKPLGKRTTALLDEISEKYEAVGVSAALIENGSVTRCYSYGFADIENKKAVDKDTLFRVASMSKPIVIMTVMKLSEDGVIDIDKDISEYLGFNVRNPKYIDIPITARMLMTHTSTLVDTEKFNKACEGYSDRHIEEILKDKKAYSNKKPGTSYAYTNLGIALLGCVAEKASGERLADVCRKYIISPIGVDASFDTSEIKNTDKVANLYKHKEQLTRSSEDILSSPVGQGVGELYHVYQGAFLSSAVDYGKLTTVLLNDGKYMNKSVLSEKSVKQILSEQFCDEEQTQYLGFKKYDGIIEGQELYGHTGNAYGVFSGVVFDREKKNGVVVITSGAKAEKAADGQYDICSDIIKTLYENELK